MRTSDGSGVIRLGDAVRYWGRRALLGDVAIMMAVHRFRWKRFKAVTKIIAHSNFTRGGILYDIRIKYLYSAKEFAQPLSNEFRLDCDKVGWDGKELEKQGMGRCIIHSYICKARTRRFFIWRNQPVGEVFAARYISQR